MSRRLTSLFYDQQIIEIQWRKPYKNLIDVEFSKNSHTVNKSAKAREEFESQFHSYIMKSGVKLTHLLIFQGLSLNDPF
jgi:hypothetical protein